MYILIAIHLFTLVAVGCTWLHRSVLAGPYPDWYLTQAVCSMVVLPLMCDLYSRVPAADQNS